MNRRSLLSTLALRLEACPCWSPTISSAREANEWFSTVTHNADCPMKLGEVCVMITDDGVSFLPIEERDA